MRSSTGTATSPFGFAGEQTDDSGLQYLRARYYDPAQGRFITRDPFRGWQQLPYSQHPYQYGYSNPIEYIDPSGNNPACLAFAVADGLLPVGDAITVACVVFTVSVAWWAATHPTTAQSTTPPITGQPEHQGESIIGTPLQTPPASVITSSESRFVETGAGFYGGPTENACPAPTVSGVPWLDPQGPSIWLTESDPTEPRGGTYILRDPVTGQVMRTGRTNDLQRRRREHARNPETAGLRFEVDRRTDNYDAQRGREQMLREKYNPPLNKVGGVDQKRKHHLQQRYQEAAKELE